MLLRCRSNSHRPSGRTALAAAAIAILALSPALTLSPAGLIAADRSADHSEGLRENPPDVWILRNATVVINPDVSLPNASIVIRQGKIDSVGTDIAIPDDARQIDLTGRTVYPGFLDAYATAATGNERLAGTAAYWNSQITPQKSIATQFHGTSNTSTLRKQGFVAQLLVPADGVIKGTSALVSLQGGSANDRILRADVAQHLELTAPRRSRTDYPGSPMGAVALARQAVYDAQWYRDAVAAAAADPALPKPERNDALAALRPILDGTMPVVVRTSNEQFILRAEHFAAEFGLNLIICGSGNEYRRLKEIAAAQRPLIIPLAFPDAPNVSTADAAREVTLESLMHWDLAPENPGRVEAAGIRFALCTHRLASTG
ncbi:MAG: hypothetical protein KDA85_21450, partial [Planctomycetaceae bacterium]|nr:hypothetical protein [Planctomycetaceae bacterium]